MTVSMIASAGLMVGVSTAAAGHVREKEADTIEQLLVTSLRSHELIIATASACRSPSSFSFLYCIAAWRWSGLRIMR